MSIGTGIFLSSIFLGIIALFIATKDRWNWAKGMKRIGLALIVVLVIGSGGAAWYLYQDSIPTIKPLEAQTRLWSLELGMSVDDVLFIKGKPSNESRRGKNNYRSFTYNSEIIYKKEQWIVGFNDNNKVAVIFLAAPARGSRPLMGISTESTLDDVLQKLGDPTDIYISEDRTFRSYYFEKYNVAFYLRKNKVIQYGLSNRKFLIERDEQPNPFRKN